ncbi:MAG TPA: succinate dehydrogenase hydrophobic membrane anchor subunit [Pseudolysinimonas sp.]|jgi:succinate dehydrogenase / fumarate reductase membrane anchor subunit|nr:succinate dehydrogenase [Schumannella sp.]HEV7742728.1 succinate dehydrogenase hydrophobic membrane anchor subunit [Pseudolysinimonas sp.]
MTTETIEPPRSAARARGGVNWEKWGWLYMRFSGVLLVVLIFGHLLVNLFLGQGVSAIDFAFVAGKLANPFWIVWDTLLLWLALIHGANGMRTLTNDYARGKLRIVLLVLLAGATVTLLALGTLVLTTFDPCIGSDQVDALIEVCR